jgi:hypothetical protein
MCENLAYTYYDLLNIIPTADRERMILITTTVCKEKALYEVLTISKIQQAISKRLKVLGAPLLCLVLLGFQRGCEKLPVQ